MEKGYYYVFSSSLSTYNSRNGGSKTRRRVHVNNNGRKDYYYKESLMENGNEIVTKEEGNKELEKLPGIGQFPNFKINLDKFFSPWIYHRLPSSTKGKRGEYNKLSRQFENADTSKLIPTVIK